MVNVKKGDCEHCNGSYRYSLWHSGFGDNSYAYCDDCGMLAILNYSNPSVAAFPPLAVQFAEIDAAWEPLVQPCTCGGRFRKGAAPRCPHCNQRLSPTHAAAHIQAQATGAGRDWRWQNTWSGVYCVAMENPQTPGYPRQLIDPVSPLHTAKSEAKSRSRWSLLFSLGR